VSETAEQALSHLGTEAKRLATRPDAERLQAMRRDRWIDYARASTVLRELERLYETPPRERMPCMLLYGESNIGKTLITRKFEREHPPQCDAARGIAAGRADHGAFKGVGLRHARQVAGHIHVNVG